MKNNTPTQPGQPMTEPFTLPPEIEAAKLAFGKALKEWAEGVVGDRKHRTEMVNKAESRLDAAILAWVRQMGETREPERKTSAPGICDLCGEPMPPGEEMFKFHGYSGDCPKPAPVAEPLKPEVSHEVP